MFVNILGILLIAFIAWWFWLAKPKTARKNNGATIDIVVGDGVYTPSRIEVAKGQVSTLRFIRKDPSPCAEKVIIDDMDLSAELPMEKHVELKIKPEFSGTYAFTCQMGMYRGEIVVL